jgi:membrane protein implicated in regulation of membrane protease activity
MSNAWLWAIGGLVLVGAEVLMPGVFLLWLGIAALCTAGLTTLLPISLEVQLGLFTICAVLSCVVGWLIYRQIGRKPRAAEAVNNPQARVVGSVGHVTETIRDGQGKVRIGDSDWLAEGPDLATGAAVRVKALHGNTVKVEAL